MALHFPDINPIALSLGSLQIRWYALAYLAGFVLGWRYALYLVGPHKAEPLTRESLDDFLSWAILAVILGGRMGYVLFYQTGAYFSDPLEIFKIWHGGMSFHGGALGMIAAMVAYTRLKKIPLLRLSDVVVCVVPIGLFFGRLANFVNGELYGRVSTAPWAVVFPHAGDLPRHPSQIYEALLEGVLLFCVLFLLSHKTRLREKPGMLSGVFLAGYGLCRFTVEFFREPDAQLGYILGFLTMGQILCLPMVAGGLFLMFHARRLHDRA